MSTFRTSKIIDTGDCCCRNHFGGLIFVRILYIYECFDMSSILPTLEIPITIVSNTRDKMTFHWTGPNAIEDGEESGSMALSPVLKNHNAYLVHNETLYCDQSEEWRGKI